MGSGGHFTKYWGGGGGGGGKGVMLQNALHKCKRTNCCHIILRYMYILFTGTCNIYYKKADTLLTIHVATL